MYTDFIAYIHREDNANIWHYPSMLDIYKFERIQSNEREEQENFVEKLAQFVIDLFHGFEIFSELLRAANIFV